MSSVKRPTKPKRAAKPGRPQGQPQQQREQQQQLGATVGQRGATVGQRKAEGRGQARAVPSSSVQVGTPSGAGRSSPSSRPSTRGRKFPAEPLTPSEVLSILQACSTRAPTGIRNRALISVLYRAGLRVSEALAIFPKDLDATNGTVRVLHGKGDRSRLAGLDPEAVAIVEKWIERRGRIGLNGRHPLFCTLQGKPIWTPYVRNLLHRLARKVGIEKRVHPHGLRHTHAFELANEGQPLHVIQQQLGHSSLATTDKYVRHLTSQQVVDAIRGRTWGK